MIAKTNLLLWIKHLNFAFLLSLRAEYTYGISVAAACFLLFLAMLWGLFSYNRKTWHISGIGYNERETVILKSLLFSLFTVGYYTVIPPADLITPLVLYFFISRIYRGNWAFFQAKHPSASETYSTVKKLWGGLYKDS